VDGVAGDAGFDGDALDVLAPAARIHAHGADLSAEIDRSGGRPCRDVGAGELDREPVLRPAEHDLAILDADASDADAERADVHRIRDRKDLGAPRRPRAADRELDAKIGRERGERDRAPPHAGDVDRHVHRRRAERRAAGRCRAPRRIEIDQRHPAAPRLERDATHADRLPERLGQQGLHSLGRERRTVDAHDGPRADDDDADPGEHGKANRPPPPT
jgi:hypothetical protein